MLPGKEIFLLFIGLLMLQLTKASNVKHMYALCPPDFFGIGTQCYYISQNKVNWLDAHFDCKDRKSRLAEPNKYEDRMIRKFLTNNDLNREIKWIGGSYNWAQKKWQWQDGKEFTYQSFSQMPGGATELQYHCAILNPNLKYRWSASSCVDKHQYICQHRMPYVNEKHRSRIYTKWNQTYPNEQATQVEVVLNDSDILKRDHRQSIPKNGRSTNVQRLSRHRYYLANEWLKKYKSQHIILNRNQVLQKRRNPSIRRDDFLNFERKKNVNRGALLTNKVDDFDRHHPVRVAGDNAPNTQQNEVIQNIPPPRRPQNEDTPRRQQYGAEQTTSPPSRRKMGSDIEQKEKRRLEESRKLLENGRYDHPYTRRRISSTTPITEASVDVDERIELERNREYEIRRRQQEEERERRKQDEKEQEREIQDKEAQERDRQDKKAQERDRQDKEEQEMERLDREEQERARQEKQEQERARQEKEAQERELQEYEVQNRRREDKERLQNQIHEEKLLFEREEEMRRSRIKQEELQRVEERKRIHEQHIREREELMRKREQELKEREEEEQRIREDEERRQLENRQRVEEIERKQREEEERQRKEEEDKKIEEENRRRIKEELKNKMKKNQVTESNEEEQLNDLREDVRLKEKLRRERLARIQERIKNLSPEDQIKFFQLKRMRQKKQSEGKEN